MANICPNPTPTSLALLNLGSGPNTIPNAINLDSHPYPGVQEVFDLERCGKVGNLPPLPLPFDDNTFTEIRAINILQYIDNILPLMQELYRVAKPGAVMHISVPHVSSNEAWADPLRKRTLATASFLHFGQPYYQHFDYGYTGDWAIHEIVYCIPKQFFIYWEAHDMDPNWEIGHGTNIISSVRVVLTCEKPGRARDLKLQDHIQVQISMIPEEGE